MKGNGVPLVVTYNPSFKNLGFLIRMNLQFLYADPETKKVFTPAPFVSFRSARNLKTFFVRSKVYPLERKVCSAKCNGKPFQVFLSINKTCKVCGIKYVRSTNHKFCFSWNNYN